MAIFEQAREELRRLESHWICLLEWLAEKSGVSPDDLVSRWNADEYFRAKQVLDLTYKAAGRSAPKWSVLHFLNFGRYSELAGFYNVDLLRLGKPDRDWRDVLAQHQKNGGIVSLRNNLQHANRFAMLSVEVQQRGLALLKEQRECLVKWWPDCPFSNQPPPPAEGATRTAIRLLGPNPDDALPLVERLGMREIQNARNLIDQTGIPSEITRRLGDVLDGLYQVGDKQLGAAKAAVYLATLREWPQRSAERDRVRRRVAKALRDRGAEDQRIVLLVDAQGAAPDVELILPRVREGKGVGTVRAVVATQAPTRHHVSLIDALAVGSATTLPQLARRWIDAFSVETVTKRFYEEFRELRNRLIEELRRCNPDIAELQGDPSKDRDLDLELHAFGTRQLSRILFLWFLQQKRWLGGSSAGDGNPNFLTDLFRDHAGDGDGYFADVLVPIFFDALGCRLSDPLHKAVEARFGPLPHLGGGIFTASANEFEARVFAIDDEGTPTRRLLLPDDFFDPRKDDADAPASRRNARNRTVLGLLRGYRFTTQESTPDDQSVDPDPELLGKVFENLYQADERHATGAYYTPREIVQFMCRRTLDAYLREKTSVEQETLDWLREEATDWTVSDRRLPDHLSDALITALDRVRVIDPAVGSGAFLLTMMHEIVTLHRGIEQSDYDRDVEKSSTWVADRKRRVATDSLYGVDINPMAVEICQLRLWLSIIVDLEISNFRQIPTLPNLDFRIVAGDSLIDRMGKKRFEESLPKTEYLDLETHRLVKGLQDKVDALKLRWRRYEGGEESDQKATRKLRQEIREKQVQIARVQVEYELRITKESLNLRRGPTKAPSKKLIAEETAHVANLEALLRGLHDRAPYQKPFLWPVNFHEVFENGGFDIALANPPYVRQESLDAIDQQAYSHAFPEVHSGTADLLVYFYARAVQILREGGQLAFITSNSFVKRAYGTKIQQFLAEKVGIDTVIDFGETSIFDAVVEPYVLVGRKGDPGDDHELDAHLLYVEIARRTGSRSASPAVVREQLGDLEALLAADHVRMPQATFAENGWKIDSPEVIALFRRLMGRGTPLGEFVQGRMYYGIKTGLNEAFVIDEAKREELIAVDPRSAELIKPWLRGRDIRRWKPQWAGLHIIFTRRGTKIDDYPAIKSHLTRWKRDLTPKARGAPRDAPGRKPGDYKWFEIQDNIAYYAEFDHQKVFWPEFARQLRFCMGGPGVMANNKCYLWAEPPSWVLPVLNSELIEFLLCQITSQIRGSFMQLYDHFVRRLPIVEPSESIADALAKLAEAMIRDPDDVATERAIETQVRSLYGISKQDSKLIDAWFAKRSLSAQEEDDVDDDD